MVMLAKIMLLMITLMEWKRRQWRLGINACSLQRKTREYQNSPTCRSRWCRCINLMYVYIYLPLMMPVYKFDAIWFVGLFVCIYSEYKMMTIEMKNCVVFPNGLWSTYSNGLRFHASTKVTLEYIRQMEWYSLKMGGTMWHNVTNTCHLKWLGFHWNRREKYWSAAWFKYCHLLDRME